MSGAQPPGWLVHWCAVYLRHVGPWLVWGLVVAHVFLWAILRVQRRRPETGAAAALRRFVGCKAAFWFVLAVAPTGGSGAMPSPWWIVAYAAVVTWVVLITYWLVAMMVWTYVVPALWPGHGGTPGPPDEMLPAEPKGWDGGDRRTGPPERRQDWPPPGATA